MTRSGMRLNIFALAAFTGYAVILLHPLWIHSGTHVAGYDYFNYNWNFWWIRHAWENGLNIYLNDFVMFPAVSNYGYHALTAFWYPVWAILEPAIGTLHVVNVIVTTVCILNGYLMFVWLRSEAVHPGLALLGGVLLQTLPITRYWYYNTHLNLMDWFWIPGLLLMWKWIYVAARSADRLSGRAIIAAIGRGLVFGLGLWGLLLTDLQFPIFAFFIVVPYGLLTIGLLIFIRTSGRSAMRLFLLAMSGGVAVAFGLLLMWFAGPLPYIASFSGGLVPGPVADRPGIDFPMGWLTMAAEWWKWDQPSVGWFVTLSLLGSIGVAAFLSLRSSGTPWKIALRRMISPQLFWLLVAIPPFVLAMGPSVEVWGRAVPMPFVALYDFTNGNFRMPWRLAPAGVIAAATFIGLFWTPIIRSAQKRKTPGFPQTLPFLGAGLLLLSHTAVRLFETAPLEPVLPNYAAYAAMEDDAEPYVVVEAPTGMGTGEVLLGNSRAIQYQWYGMIHEKRMVNGFISRTPIENFYYIDRDDALLSWLGQRRLLEPGVVRAQLEERIRSYPIGYIVLHTQDIAQQSPTATDEIVGFFNGLPDLLCPPMVEGVAVFYRTRWHPDGCDIRLPRETAPGNYEIDIGNSEDRRYVGWGWYYGEPVGGLDWRWMGGEPQLAATASAVSIETTLYADLPPGDYVMSITGQAYEEPRTLQIQLNAVDIGTPLVFEPNMLSEQQSLPFRVAQGVSLTFIFRPSGSLSPQALGRGEDSRMLSIAIDRITFDRIDGNAGG